MSSVSTTVPHRTPAESPPPTRDTENSPHRRGCLHAWKLLEDLEKAIETIPDTIPEGQDDDLIAKAATDWPEVEDPSEAWEKLDPVLNRLLGYGMTAEKLAKEVHHGSKGIDGVLGLIRHFVMTYDTVTGHLLERKMAYLLEAIHIM